MKKNKIKAYTILELLITMVVTSIIVSILYLLFLTLSQRYEAFNRNEFEVTTISLFKNTIKRDFYRSDFLLLNTKELKCIRNGEAVIYSFGEKFIKRKAKKNNIVDTFTIKVKQIDPVFINDNKLKLLKRIALKVDFLGREIGVHLSKDYASDILINQKFADGN